MKSFAANLFLAFILMTAGCSTFPELDERETREDRAADFPELSPIESLTNSGTVSRIDPEDEVIFEARIANLKARAAKLKGSVIGPNARNRLSQTPVVAEAS